MSSPLLNFVAAIGIGLVLGIVGGLVLRNRSASALWLVPALALAGTLVASLLALMFGDDSNYGWKEASLQVVLAIVGVGVAYVLAGRSGAGKAVTTGQ
jgi:hypothetical protein